MSQVHDSILGLAQRAPCSYNQPYAPLSHLCTRHLVPSKLGLLGCILSLPLAPTGAFDRFEGRLGDPLSDDTDAKNELEAGVPIDMELW